MEGKKEKIEYIAKFTYEYAKNVYGEKPQITVSGSCAALFNKDLYGKSVFRPQESIEKSSDIDIAATCLETEGYTRGQKGDKEKICIFYNTPIQILTIPAAAYALHPNTSHMVIEGKGKPKEIVNITREVLTEGEHPLETYKELYSRSLSKEERELIISVNLGCLIESVKYNLISYRDKLEKECIELHDILKVYGSFAAFIHFLNKNYLIPKHISHRRIGRL